MPLRRLVSPSSWRIATLLVGTVVSISAQEGHWNITQLPITNGFHPVINNSGEIVYYLTAGGGMFSTVRGKLADSGTYPHLANSGEVVYADWFGGPAWDLASTTRGRLTYGAIIDINFSDFDVNTHGEVVYVVKDTNGFAQVYSSIRNQITHDTTDHYRPCINDHGEIIWTQLQDGVGAVTVSSTRGVIPGNAPQLLDLNNSGEFCFSGNLEGPPGNYSFPHIFTSAHGAIINDTNQFQWEGSMNDAGVIVWEAPDPLGSSTWYVYQAEWIANDTTPPRIISITATPNVLWPPNRRMVPIRVHVNAVDNLDPSPVVRITQVTSNEPQHPRVPDWEITGALSLNLRADRLGRGRGRIYTIVVQCEDKDGNASSASVNVTVPHEMKGAYLMLQRMGRPRFGYRMWGGW
jgi:hypothetical protein